MPPPDRRRYDERDDDRDLPPPVRFTNPVVIGVLVSAGLLAIGCVVVGGFALLGWRGAPQPMGAPPAVVADKDEIQPEGGKEGDAKRVYTRQEFGHLVMGKTPGEVRTLLGPPKKETESPKRVVWYYQERTSDPATSQLDQEAQVVFENERVVQVSY
jgi:hypothetical protein